MKKIRFTLEDLRKSKVAQLNKMAFEMAKQPEKKHYKVPPGGRCEQAQAMWGLLADWAMKSGIMVEREWKFHPIRKWRFDFFIPTLKVACEYEGIFSKKSRHTTQGGYSGDVEKYREAAKMGITVFRYTAKDFKNVLKDLHDYINKGA